MQRGREGNRGEGIGVELSLPSRGLRGQPASRTSVRRNTWTNKGDRKRPRKESWKPPLVFGDSKLMAVMGGGEYPSERYPSLPICPPLVSASISLKTVTWGFGSVC